MPSNSPAPSGSRSRREVEQATRLPTTWCSAACEHLHDDTEEGTLEAIPSLFERAVDLDPDYSRAYAALAAAELADRPRPYWFVTAGAGWAHAYDGSTRSSRQGDEPAHASRLCDARRQPAASEGRYEESFAAIDKAMAMAPSDAAKPWSSRHAILNAIGRAEDAETEVRLASSDSIRYSPPATLRVLADVRSSTGATLRRGRRCGRTPSGAAGGHGSTTTWSWPRRSAISGGSMRFPAVIAAYDALALPAAYDTFTIEGEPQKFWLGDAFNYHTPLYRQSGRGTPPGRGFRTGRRGPISPLDSYKPPDRDADLRRVRASRASPRSMSPRRRPFAIAAFPSSTSGPTWTTTTATYGRGQPVAVARPHQGGAGNRGRSGRRGPVLLPRQVLPGLRLWLRPRRSSGGTIASTTSPAALPAWADAGYPVEVSETQ